MQKFSFILPVRNGGSYVKECVQSILSQTLTDFNLIVLDNASDDGTAEWLQSLKDERIVIYSSVKSLSIEENWARILTVARNEFMTCIGHDDIVASDYLQIMNALIRKHPDASLYLAHFWYIDLKGRKIRSCKPMQEKQDPQEVLKNFMQINFDVTGTGYVMRSNDYDAVGGIPAYPSLLFSDFELWLNLSLKSYLAVAGEECFAFRLHQSTTTSSADKQMLAAFEKFIDYLAKLKISNPQLAPVIIQNAATLLNFYARGLTSRLLRTPVSQRQGLFVKDLIEKFRSFGLSLATEFSYDPKSNNIVRIADLIDSNPVSRKLFLLFKKIYNKPVVK